MANLRVFVSSTAYDLGVLRSSLRGFIDGLGYVPVLSEYSDVLYDPREHAHKSCIAEIVTCDMVVLVVGGRFGSSLNDDVLTASLKDLDRRQLSEDAGQPLSVTQAEALAAARTGIPLFTFVDADVYHDYSVYQRNKGKPFAKEIAYPSISQSNTAEYIFNFIDYLQSRSFNNAVIPFARLEDVLAHLQKQWAGLFQRMLAEARSGRDESMRIDRLADQFEDLKAALLATVGGDAGSRAVAKWVIRSRRLFDFLRSLPNPGRPMREAFIAGDRDFPELLQETARVVALEDFIPVNAKQARLGARTLLRVEAGPDLLTRFRPHLMERLERDWQDIRGLQSGDREVIFDALFETTDRALGTPLVFPVPSEDDGVEEDGESPHGSSGDDGTTEDLMAALRRSVEEAKRARDEEESGVAARSASSPNAD